MAWRIPNENPVNGPGNSPHFRNNPEIAGIGMNRDLEPGWLDVLPVDRGDFAPAQRSLIQGQTRGSVLRRW
jgi:hypothetical protein